MPDWVVWMLITAALAFGELATLTLFLGPLAAASALAALLAAVGLGLELQVLAFIVASVTSLVILRPLARSHIHLPAQLRSGTAALVGTTATVVGRVDRSSGLVKIGGEIWSARAYDSSKVLEPGQEVVVLEIKGATALVSE